jgi:hypothetical protein
MNKSLKKAIDLISTSHKHVLEFGVCEGKTLRQIRKDLDESYKVFGFDSFEGLPEDWVGTRAKKGDLSCGGKIPDINNVTFYKGWFKDTIPKYKEIKEPIAILHCDADLYSSTIDILYGLNDCIVKGTILVFDEWYYNHKDIPSNKQHEQKAFYEWVKDKERKYEIQPQIEDERRIIIITE